MGKLSTIIKAKAAVNTMDLDIIVQQLRVFVGVMYAACVNVGLHNLMLNILMH